VSGPTAPRESPGNGERQRGRDFDVFRLRLGHVIAFVAALALLFVMAGPWYTTNEGVRARTIEHRVGQGIPGWDLIDPAAVDDARQEAKKDERNAWKTSSVLDVLVLVGLLATVGLSIAAAALRAAGRTYDPRRSPSALAGAAAVVAFVLVIAQALARLGPASPVAFQVGLPLGVIALGAIALGSAMAVRDAIDDGEGPGRMPAAAAAGNPGAGGARRGPEAPGGATYNRAP
jgi:drug/metabolite transporter (DMT)-like permease